MKQNKFEEARKEGRIQADRAVRENWDIAKISLFIRNKKSQLIPQAFEDWTSGWVEILFTEMESAPMSGEVVSFGHREYFLINQIEPLVFDCVDLTLKRRCTQFPLSDKAYEIRKATDSDRQTVIQILHRRAGMIEHLDV